MAKHLHPPEKLVLNGNLKENFRKFKQQFEIYITTTGLKDKTADIQCATLLHVIGPDAVEILTHSSGMKTETLEGMIRK